MVTQESASAPVEAIAADPAPVAEAPATEAAPAAQPKAFVVSAIAKAEREKRAALKRVRELESAPKATAPAGVSLADLKAEYEADPEAFLAKVAGEDFYGLASRIAKKAAPPTQEETVKAVAAKLEALEAKEKAADAERAKQNQAEADARTKAALAEVSTLMTAKTADDTYQYPTLATLDPELGENPEETAYDAVVFAWQQDGKPNWSEAEQKDRLHAAFAGLEAHYSRFRQPKERNQPTTPAATSTEPSPTITNSVSSGRAPAPRPRRAESQEQQIRRLLKEAGLPQDI